MNGFHDFDDFRVSAWMNEGLIIRLENATKKVQNTIKKAAVAAFSASALIAASTLSVSATVSAAPLVSPSMQVHPATALEAELARMSASIDQQLKDLPNLSVDSVDHELYKFAHLALTASESRSFSEIDAIAANFFEKDTD